MIFVASFVTESITSITIFAAFVLFWSRLLAAEFGMSFLTAASAGYTGIVSWSWAVAGRVTHSIAVAALDSRWIRWLVAFLRNMIFRIAVAASTLFAIGTITRNMILHGLSVTGHAA